MKAERYHLGMRSSTLVLVAVAALGLYGCNQGNDNGAGAKSEYTTGIKELGITDPVEGTGREVAEGDQVFVLYRGTFLKDGKQFDANMDDPTSAMPFSFTAGPTGGVIEGWQKGLIGMKEGGTRILEVPFMLAYGPQGDGNKIPAAADLKFEIKLLYVMKKGEEGVYDVNDDKVGTGAVAKAGDTVRFHYKGTYLSGKVWDDSRERGEPVDMKMENIEENMPGLVAGLEGMKVGGTRTLVLPPDLAFGMSGNEGLTGSQPIKIVVDLLAVNGK